MPATLGTILVLDSHKSHLERSPEVLSTSRFRRRSGDSPLLSFITIAVVATTLVCGCGGRPVPDVSQNFSSSRLSVSPSSINLGDVAIGDSRTQTVTLTTVGNGSVTISQATITGAGFSMSGLSLPITPAAGQSTSFSVTFAPTATGTVTGSVSVLSNASNSPTVVSLSGTGVNSHFVALAWDASTSRVAGYNVYRGTRSGGPYGKLNSSLVVETTYTDTTVQGGQTYYYVTTAVDLGDVESGYSNEAHAAVPSP